MTQHTDPNEGQAFEAKARAAFDASVARLDGTSRSRLNQARQLALAEIGRPGFRIPGLWLPAGAFASVAALAVAVFLVMPQHATHQGVEASAVEEVDLLAANENLDLYAEDPEFFEWAGGETHEAGQPAAAAADEG